MFDDGKERTKMKEYRKTRPKDQHAVAISEKLHGAYLPQGLPSHPCHTLRFGKEEASPIISSDNHPPLRRSTVDRPRKIDHLIPSSSPHIGARNEMLGAIVLCRLVIQWSTGN